MGFALRRFGIFCIAIALRNLSYSAFSSTLDCVFIFSNPAIVCQPYIKDRFSRAIHSAGEGPTGPALESRTSCSFSSLFYFDIRGLDFSS